jgi:VCPO second helical-bundle domain
VVWTQPVGSVLLKPAIANWSTKRKTSAFCAAHAQASRRFLGSDTFGWSVPAPKGSSVIEPGITPASDIVIGPFATFTDFETICGLSRFWGGIHFLSSLPAGHDIGQLIGDLAYEFLRQHIDGTAPAP